MASRNRGQKKPKLRDLSRYIPTDEEKSAIYAFIENGPPVAVAILGGASIESELEKLLRKRFRRRDDDTWEELTDERGPLSNFAAKILAGYAFGFYDKRTRTNLDIVRHVRNAFAHAKKLITFDDPLILKELKRVEVPPKKARFHADLATIKAIPDGGHNAFVELCVTLETQLISINILRLESKARYYERRASSMKQKTTPPSLGFFASALLSPPPMPPISSQPWLQDSPPGDPIHTLPRPISGALWQALEEETRKKDK